MIGRKLTVSDDDRLLKNLEYYCGYDTFRHVLKDEDHKLKIMNACMMNNPQEGHVLANYLAINKTNVFPVQMFLKSFSLAKDNLHMWNKYSDRGKGLYVTVTKSFLII